MKMRIDHLKTSMTLFVGISCLAVGYLVGSKWGASKNVTHMAKDDVYAVVNGQKIRAEEVLPRIATDLRQLEKNIYELKRQAVEDLIVERNRSSEGPIQEVEIRPEELEKFASERGIRLNALNAKAKLDFENNFRMFKQMQQRKSNNEKSAAENKIQWLIPMTFLEPAVRVGSGPWPELAQNPGSHDVVIFAHYHCPECQDGFAKIKQLEERHKGQVSIHMRFNYEDSDEGILARSVMAAACAHDQGKFKEAHSILQAKAPQNPEDLAKQLQAAGLDSARLENCMKDSSMKSKIEADLKEAKNIGVLGKSTVFIEGRPFPMAESLELWDTVLMQSH